MRGFRPTVFAGCILALAACSDESTSPMSVEQEGARTIRSVAGRSIPNAYIVRLKDGADPRSVAAVAGVEPRHVYEHAVVGFAATLNQGQLNALQHNPNVQYIEEDQLVTAAATQSNATWGLDRINQRDLPLDGSYSYTYTGKGVRTYIIDTGIDSGHGDFGGRSQHVYNSTGDGKNYDCNGHGTHVAGTVSGARYGVAKESLPRGVKVLGCDGSGTNSGVIAGIDWVRANHIKPAVANMSLGGGFSQTENDAALNLSNAGVFLAVAAGNENQDACNVSPASAGYGTAVTTVAASDKTDTRASFSNYGKCVDLYAPGVGITSAWIGSGSTETNTISGTSMASPHVAGVSALVKQRYGDISSASVATYIRDAATGSKIKSNPTGTPNLLLYKYITAW